jgi:hypothetical protein
MRDTAELNSTLDTLLNKQPAREHSWTKTHSFFATMGGFAFDTTSWAKDAGLNILPNGRHRVSITARGMRFLALHRPNIVPDISHVLILDKSKASSLAKTLVCLQALWFCIQCINRLAGRLSITLLELNTFAHSICTLLIYALWWNKPLDIIDPILLNGEDSHGACALMTLASKLGHRREFDSFKFSTPEPLDEADEETLVTKTTRSRGKERLASWDGQRIGIDEFYGASTSSLGNNTLGVASSNFSQQNTFTSSSALNHGEVIASGNDHVTLSNQDSLIKRGTNMRDNHSTAEDGEPSPVEADLKSQTNSNSDLHIKRLLKESEGNELVDQSAVLLSGQSNVERIRFRPLESTNAFFLPFENKPRSPFRSVCAWSFPK